MICNFCTGTGISPIGGEFSCQECMGTGKVPEAIARVCKKCGGTGYLNQKTCPECQGWGDTHPKQTAIPACKSCGTTDNFHRADCKVNSAPQSDRKSGDLKKDFEPGHTMRCLILDGSIGPIKERLTRAMIKSGIDAVLVTTSNTEFKDGEIIDLAVGMESGWVSGSESQRGIKGKLFPSYNETVFMHPKSSQISEAEKEVSLRKMFLGDAPGDTDFEEAPEPPLTNFIPGQTLTGVDDTINGAEERGIKE